jgi:diguanylate cyclase (GGDEF)-like protein
LEIFGNRRIYRLGRLALENNLNTEGKSTKSKGLGQILMKPDTFNGCSSKRPENFKSKSYPFDATLLSMTVNPQMVLGPNVPRLLVRREEKAADDIFQALLSDANRELSSLLEDVRAVQDNAPLGDIQGGPINELLRRAVRCATKQYLLQAELGKLALTDELTGLYNRRGFMTIAERQLKVGRRSGRGMLLFFIDVDALKQINDSFGHSEGDRALKRAAKALGMTFRDSDVIARLGGDEFAVLAIEASDHSETTIRTRLYEDLESISAEESRYAISLSLGVARFDPHGRASIGELMAKADQAMYEQRRRRLKLLVEMETRIQSH